MKEEAGWLLPGQKQRFGGKTRVWGERATWPADAEGLTSPYPSGDVGRPGLILGQFQSA